MLLLPESNPLLVLVRYDVAVILAELGRGSALDRYDVGGKL